MSEPEKATDYKICKCGKRGYASLSKAKKHCRKMSETVRFYFCKLGHLFHVTQQRKKHKSLKKSDKNRKPKHHKRRRRRRRKDR